MKSAGLSSQLVREARWANGIPPCGDVALLAIRPTMMKNDEFRIKHVEYLDFIYLLSERRQHRDHNQSK